MAAYDDLISYIQSIVRTNLNEEITGQNMQEVLLSIVQIVGARQFKGVANPNTNPGIPAGQSLYITAQPGTYQYFNNLVVENELCLLLWNELNWEKQTIYSLSLVSDVYAEDDPYFPVEHLYKTINGVAVDQLITTILKPQGLVWGGRVSWLDGMLFAVSAAIYYITGDLHYSEDTIVEISAADPDHDRIDVIVVDNNDLVTVVVGIPSVNPVKPYVDPTIQIELTSITVPAGAIGLGGDILREIIYNENVEWTGTGSGVTVDFDHAVNPYFGVKCANVGVIGNGDYLKFINDDPIAVVDFDVLNLAINLKAAAPSGDNLTVTFYHDGNVVSAESILTINKKAYNKWQHVYINLSSVKFTGTQYDEVRFTWRSTGGDFNGFLIDYIRIEVSLDPPPVSSSIILTGDVTGTGVTGFPVRTVLKSVNANVGQFGSATKIPKVTVNGKGLVTAVEEVDAAGGSLEFDPVTATFDGLKIQLVAGENLVKGQPCYMFASKMYRGDADAVVTAYCFAIATDTIAADATGMFLLIGVIGGYAGLTVGAPVYLSTATGALTQALVSGSNDVVQIMGVAISATHIYFKPELAQVELL
jgi:hypothetical protein